MDAPTASVVVFEDNKTRAELYSLWLDEFDVDICLTKPEVGEVLDEQTAVAVLDQKFADGAAETLLEVVRDAAPVCRVVSTRDRSSAFPTLGVDHQLTKPVFEEDLVDLVRTLTLRANYQIVLQAYYQTSAKLVPYEVGSETENEEYARLQQRSMNLRKVLNRLRQDMTSEDVSAVLEDITIENFETTDEATKIDSKYRPDECAKCDAEWEASSARDAQFTRLGAYVWRCTSCGYVQMHVDPSHQHVSSYRK